MSATSLLRALLASPARKLARIRGFAPFPSGIDLYLSGACNLRCAYCPRAADVQRLHAMMDTTKAIRLIESVARFRPMIRMIGGEPFLHPEWPGIVAAAVARGLSITAVTNGTKLPGRAEELVRSGLYAVGISIDPPEANDAHRGAGVFSICERVVREIAEAKQKLRSPTPLVEIYTTVHEDTYRFLARWAESLAGWQIDTLRIQHKMWLRSAQLTSSELLIRKALGDSTFFASEVAAYTTDEMPDVDLDVLREQLREIHATRHPFRLEAHPPLPIDEIAKLYGDPAFRRSTARPCTLTSTHAFVDPEGRLFPCLSLEVGNVFDEPFEDVWNSRRFRAYRRLLLRELRLPLCERCPG